MMRKFRYSDEVLIEYASTVSGHLENDLEAFTAFDKDLNTAKHDQLKQLIATLQSEGGDTLKVMQQSDQTEKLLQEINASKMMFSQIRYWVLKAFPDRNAIQRMFGVGRFKVVSASQPRLVEFMFELAESVKTYEAELKAAGAPESLLNGVSAQAEALNKANQVQEQMKGTRTVTTESRIQQLNSLFDMLRAFNNAAEFVFFSEPAKRELYRPPSGSSSTEDELEEVA